MTTDSSAPRRLRLECPHCRKTHVIRYDAFWEHVGGKVTCPHCGTSLLVPVLDDETAQPQLHDPCDSATTSTLSSTDETAEIKCARRRLAKPTRRALKGVLILLLLALALIIAAAPWFVF